MCVKMKFPKRLMTGRSVTETRTEQAVILSMTACLNFAGVKTFFFDSQLTLVILNFLSRFDSLYFSLSARPCKYTIDVSFPSQECFATCTLDSHSKTPPSGLGLAQSLRKPSNDGLLNRQNALWINLEFRGFWQRELENYTNVQITLSSLNKNTRM